MLCSSSRPVGLVHRTLLWNCKNQQNSSASDFLFPFSALTEEIKKLESMFLSEKNQGKLKTKGHSLADYHELDDK